MKNEKQNHNELTAKNIDQKSKNEDKTLHQFLLENPELIAELDDWRETVGSLALLALISVPLEKVRENILAMIKEDKEVEDLFD
jgi:hypothetical protein